MIYKQRSFNIKGGFLIGPTCRKPVNPDRAPAAFHIAHADRVNAGASRAFVLILCPVAKTIDKTGTLCRELVDSHLPDVEMPRSIRVREERHAAGKMIGRGRHIANFDLAHA